MIPITHLTATAYRIPTDGLEADGTLVWEATTMVVVRAEAGGRHGLGYTYADASAARLIGDVLAGVVCCRDAFAIAEIHLSMLRRVRNIGRQGIAAMAISAIDTALWDLKARLLEVPLYRLLGPVREAVAAYGSGGFTSSSEARLSEQLGGWAAAGFPAVKMKVGRRPDRDPARVRAARRAIGDAVGLFVDANGAYHQTQALALAQDFAANGVSWFEEPVSSDDLTGLARLRRHMPPGIDITAGEYAADLWQVRDMLAADAVDVMQIDATRCLGLSGFLEGAALCRAHHIPLSSHCAPALHLPVCLAAPAVRHMEWFHDHARIESLIFDGAPQPCNGLLRPDTTRPGLGLDLKQKDAQRYAV